MGREREDGHVYFVGGLVGEYQISQLSTASLPDSEQRNDSIPWFLHSCGKDWYDT